MEELHNCIVREQRNTQISHKMAQIIEMSAYGKC